MKWKLCKCEGTIDTLELDTPNEKAFKLHMIYVHCTLGHITSLLRRSHILIHHFYLHICREIRQCEFERKEQHRYDGRWKCCVIHIYTIKWICLFGCLSHTHTHTRAHTHTLTDEWKIWGDSPWIFATNFRIVDFSPSMRRSTRLYRIDKLPLIGRRKLIDHFQ